MALPFMLLLLVMWALPPIALLVILYSGVRLPFLIRAQNAMHPAARPDRMMGETDVVHDTRLALIGWSVAFIAAMGLQVWFYPGETTRFLAPWLLMVFDHRPFP
jgi:hypothetical protein